LTTFILVRHGQTDWNKEGKYTGQTDIPLNQTGKTQAKLAAGKINSKTPACIYSSDLIRALNTARIIAENIPVPIFQDKRLREIHQGEWEGLHVDVIKRRFNDQFSARQKDPLNARAPGGESIGDVYRRVKDFLTDITRQHSDSPIIITAHGVVLAIFIIISRNLPIEQVFDHIPKNADPLQVEIKTI